MFKKSSDDVKKYIKLSIKCSAIFRANLIQNHTKIIENGFVHKYRQRIQVWSAFCSQTSDFSLIFRSPGSSRDVPAASQKPPIFSWIFGCLRKSARIGPWEAQGRPKAPPRHLQRSILRRFWIDFPGGFPRSLFRRSIEFLHEVFAYFFLNFFVYARDSDWGDRETLLNIDR